MTKSNWKQIDIKDTKRSPKDDVIYFALEEAEQIKEIHYRKAASGNNDLIIRDYVPPQLYARYMAIRTKANELRAADPTLKTQMRWGPRDIEIYLKTKGSKEQYKKEELNTFMGDSPLPEYDLRVQWRANGGQRKQLDFARKKSAPPSTRNDQSDEIQERHGVRRQLSEGSAKGTTKKQRAESVETDEEEDEEDMTEDPLN